MTRLVTATVAAVGLVAGRPPAAAQDKAATEKQKIEALIKHVEGLAGAKFVRNDTEYDPKSAAKFLRGKWEAEGAAIKTAKDFIDTAATASSTTGRAYLIRLPGGKEVKSGEYLSDRLKELEKAPPGKRDP